jgi:transposase InsO family protein
MKLARENHIGHPNHFWVADFTFVSIRQGFMYLTFLIDVLFRFIICWRVSSNMMTAFVFNTLARVPAEFKALYECSQNEYITAL